MNRLPFEVERKLIVKYRASTNPEYGKKPGDREIREYIKYGIINLDKPSGPTSHEVVSWVKRILEVKKAGHGGTLDPKVTGILPIALEESTKVVQTLLPAGKEYVCLMRLHEEVKEEKLRQVFKEFEGKIYQRPPVKSAVKRKLRTREIYYIEIQEVDGRNVLFKVGCEAGTYIRKLCHDIGEVVGTGAHMVELRRTKSGSFQEKDVVTLHDVIDAYYFWKEEGNEEFLRKTIQPVEKAMEYLPKIVVRDGAVDALCHGADLAVPGICELDADINQGDTVALFTLKGELIGIGKAKMNTRNMLVEDTGIAVKTKRVLMKPGVYPRMWKTKT
jgi:H/ACA ribonucleoprotein complex subunit 4